MPQIDEWIKQKLSQGFSKEQIKKALTEEGFDPTLVDLVTEEHKEKLFYLKNKLIFLLVFLSILAFSMILLLVIIESNPQDALNSLNNQDTDNLETPNAFLDKGFFVSTDKIKFKTTGNDLLYTSLSNETLDIIVLKVSRFEEPLNKTVQLINENINSSYTSIFLRKSESTTYNGHQIVLQEFVVIERNYRKIIKNVFIDYTDKTLLISYKCDEDDLSKCEDLLIESIEHISLV